MKKEGNTCCPLNTENLKEKVKPLLNKINKPSRYTGGETGSFNKDWDSASVKAVVSFPDLYEIGISNMGLRILYDKINKYSPKNFLADRAYAPEKDFKKELLDNNLPLYGVETYKPLNEFDLVAFSLQYELSYPTLLSMLDMGKIPVKSSDRSEDHPVVVAGGPGAYNPDPMVDFIDAFFIGDGETIINEVMECLDNAKAKNFSRENILISLAQINGVYVPAFYKTDSAFSRPKPVREDVPEFVSKRIDNIDTTDYPTNFPVPYGSSVHDRAVVEIRRGCTRMCRFCQPCFTNLPVRERSFDKIVNLVDEVLKNTGYEEYSLLSLSSNDYKNIEQLVRTLNEKHAKSGASVSLPSQRADNFSLELAEVVQAVRKSTVTIAPEAGSQRLRDVINKNLSEEQILNAVTSVYKAGWKSIKLYFMIGLPTETFEDLDAIAELLKTIKTKSGELKKEFNLKKFLNINCTVSIFVPKPFTPFHWCAQDSVETIENKIKYLREKTRGIKDVKLSIHDTFLTHLEAVFSRGDRSLNKLIEKMYEKGSYLDAWNEHFNKDLWIETARELQLNLEEYSGKVFGPDDEMPWDVINAGIKKDWLKSEYEKSLCGQVSSPCDESCSDCGVCNEFKTSPSLKSFEAVNLNNESMLSRDENRKIKVFSENGFKYRLKVQKTGDLRYISHLDWQKLIYSSIRKSGLKINFSQGFNPSPKISLGAALPLFVEGKNEYIDIELQEELADYKIMEKLNRFLPKNSRVSKIVKIPKKEQSLDKSVSWAKYSATPVDKNLLKKLDLNSIIKEILLKDNIALEKSTKKRIKKVNIRPAIHSLIFDESNGKLEFILKTGQGGCPDKTESPATMALTGAIEAPEDYFNGSLRADEFLRVVIPTVKWNIVREKLLDSDFNELIS